MKTYTGDNRMIALIPAYKPEEKLIELSRSLFELGFRVVIVNDGSGEEYDDVFRNAAEYALILRHDENRGKGRALKTGLRCIENVFIPPYTVVTLDADGQHSVSDALSATKRAAQSPDSLVLGTRSFKGKVPPRSRIGNIITRTVFKISTGSSVSDTQTGLRAFSNRLIGTMINISGERYEYEMNVLMHCTKSGVEMIEVPIETIYIENNKSSHFNTITDSFRIYKEILCFSASSLASFFLDYGLYCALFGITGSVSVSNVTARLFSATANYTLNKKLVFGSRASVVGSAFKYAMLAVFVLLCNTTLLKLLVSYWGINAYGAKIVTEIMMFAVSYTAQKLFVFPKKGEMTNDG